METRKERVADRIQHDREALAKQCRSLSQGMIVLATKLEGDKPHGDLCVNDLGEIQSEGTIIDALCGRLMGKIEVWRLMSDSEGQQ